MKANLPINETQRLKALHDLAILDSPREQSFDDIAQVAMQLCNVPIAVVSLVDKDRQWFKSCLGLDATETPRDVAFCAHAILVPDDVLVVEDATKDIRFVDNALVTGAPYIRFYAGAPLIANDGMVLGTLCVIDYQSRTLTADQLTSLKALARQVVQLLRLRSAHDEREITTTKLSQLFEMAPIGILQVNEAAELVESNPEFNRMIGYSHAELKGMSFLSLTPEADWEKSRQAIAELKTTGRFGPMEKHYRHKNGELIPVEVSGSIINIGQGGAQSWWTLVKDIREQKHMERMKSEFISTVSHELRTPLTSISGALGLISSNVLGELPDKVKGMLDIAYKNSQRLSVLINDLLDMEKLLAGKMSFECSAQAAVPLVQQALSENSSYADKYSVGFVLSDASAGAFIHVDGFRLQQVLNNFLSNAAKYSPPHTAVDIDLTIKGEWLRISVCDHGSGIADEFKTRIFQKFSQADSSDSRQKGGTGLGLAISKELVERMGGRIGFDTKLGEGTCFFAEFRCVNIN
jgi:PAS domain S-box-containing protein